MTPLELIDSLPKDDDGLTRDPLVITWDAGQENQPKLSLAVGQADGSQTGQGNIYWRHSEHWPVDRHRDYVYVFSIATGAVLIPADAILRIERWLDLPSRLASDIILTPDRLLFEHPDYQLKAALEELQRHAPCRHEWNLNTLACRLCGISQAKHATRYRLPATSTS